MQEAPENRNEVDELVDKGDQKKLVDSEYARRKRETSQRIKERRNELGYSRSDLSKVSGVIVSEEGCEGRMRVWHPQIPLTPLLYIIEV